MHAVMAARYSCTDLGGPFQILAASTELARDGDRDRRRQGQAETGTNGDRDRRRQGRTETATNGDRGKRGQGLTAAHLCHESKVQDGQAAVGRADEVAGVRVRVEEA